MDIQSEILWSYLLNTYWFVASDLMMFTCCWYGRRYWHLGGWHDECLNHLALLLMQHWLILIGGSCVYKLWCFWINLCHELQLKSAFLFYHDNRTCQVHLIICMNHILPFIVVFNECLIEISIPDGDRIVVIIACRVSNMIPMCDYCILTHLQVGYYLNVSE